jgi:hypothetical protein
MAIKIIKDGPDPSVVKEVVCDNCGATLEYAPIDVRHRDYVDYGGDYDTSYWIDCPKCSANSVLAGLDCKRKTT